LPSTTTIAPFVEAIKAADRSAHGETAFPVLDLFSANPPKRVSFAADVQHTLLPNSAARIGYLDLVLTDVAV